MSLRLAIWISSFTFNKKLLIPSFKNYICMCVYVEYVHMHVLWHTCGSQRTYGSRDGTAIRLGGKHLYPLSYLAGPALLRFLMISGQPHPDR